MKKVNITLSWMSPYDAPLPVDDKFGDIRGVGVTENGIRVEFYTGEDSGVYLHKNALYVHESNLEDD
ncbi:MAG: hypothetical protein GOVbin2917_154 [Prokaryotic dsDNA virus sp.]|jgi:hypothetical protein|nr:MAG: hypothetical protein GOVbin2917_154 [Prokaryotic dsDNA virus sp.]|tara:strand:- start:13932 stop:14132 length:201 start_codon:yes stop_codon:yes gene_type:complete